VLAVRYKKQNSQNRRQTKETIKQKPKGDDYTRQKIRWNLPKKPLENGEKCCAMP